MNKITSWSVILVYFILTPLYWNVKKRLLKFLCSETIFGMDSVEKVCRKLSNTIL